MLGQTTSQAPHLQQAILLIILYTERSLFAFCVSFLQIVMEEWTSLELQEII